VAVSLDIFHQFDAAMWQTTPAGSAGSALLFTWALTPPPPDGGMPESVARVFGGALCSIGPVIYAGDDESADFRWAEEAVSEPQWSEARRRGFRRFKLALFRASSAAQLLPAFTSGRHNWSMNAQWLVVLDSPAPADHMVAVVKTLYEDWTLPDRWPLGVAMIVQAAVDGDGAACFSANKAMEERFVRALGESARAAGIELRKP
jgi:hypothetical protein